MKTALLTVVLTAFLAVSIWFAFRSFTSIETEMSGHGWFAMVLGVVFSLVVGGGLMALVFYSSRRGYDDIDEDV